MAPSWQLIAFVNFQIAIANNDHFVYSQLNGRCDPLRSGYSDCSGSEIAAAHSVGANVECTGSFQIARWCHESGTGMSIEQGRQTRGAMMFLDPDNHNEGQGGTPGEDPGHVATSLGDGTVVNARNHRAGILISDFDSFGNWDYAALPPTWWFPSYSDHESPLPPPEVLKMFVSIHESHTGKGYYCVKDDGAVFAYGDAQYHGGVNNLKLAAPITDIAVLPNNKGYWLIGGDGGVFAFGAAKYLGHPH